MFIVEEECKRLCLLFLYIKFFTRGNMQYRYDKKTKNPNKPDQDISPNLLFLPYSPAAAQAVQQPPQEAQIQREETQYCSVQELVVLQATASQVEEVTASQQPVHQKSFQQMFSLLL